MTHSSTQSSVFAQTVESNTSNIVSQKHYASGIQVLWSETADTQALCETVAENTRDGNTALAIIWFSTTSHCPIEITETLKELAPDLVYSGCSTSGEVTPDGMQDHGFNVILLPCRWFSVHTIVMENVASLGMETVARCAADGRNQFLERLGNPDDKSNLFALNLIDGLSFSEETVTLAIDRGLNGIPLVGGSAGDDMRFNKTWQINNGKAYSGASVLSLIHCQLPCRVYVNNNFVPTEHKLVVTEADPDFRRVSEFNAEPAAVAYANAIGVAPEDLDAGSFASYSVVVRFGGRHFCRSIQRVNDDQSLTFFCAIDNGLVLTLARSEGMVASSREAIEEVEAEIGEIDIMIGFDCIQRKLDAQHRKATHRIAALYMEKHFVGCNTYGEQFNSMHINQTFTGIAIGMPKDELAAP